MKQKMACGASGRVDRGGNNDRRISRRQPTWFYQSRSMKASASIDNAIVQKQTISTVRPNVLRLAICACGTVLSLGEHGAVCATRDDLALMLDTVAGDRLMGDGSGTSVGCKHGQRDGVGQERNSVRFSISIERSSLAVDPSPPDVEVKYWYLPAKGIVYTS